MTADLAAGCETGSAATTEPAINQNVAKIEMNERIRQSASETNGVLQCPSNSFLVPTSARRLGLTGMLPYLVLE